MYVESTTVALDFSRALDVVALEANAQNRDNLSLSKNTTTSTLSFLKNLK